MKKEGCQVCGCIYIACKEDNDFYTKCNDCGWIYDSEVKTDEDYSKINKMSINEYITKVKKYPIIRDFIEGYRLVSTIHPDSIPLAYHHDLHGSQGCWGVIDSNWNEIITPKYLFPLERYNNNTYLACKGTGWIQDVEWDNDQSNETGKGRYWTKEEKWGLIDFKEKEIIPCIYDEILSIDNEWYDTKKDNLFAVYRHQYKPHPIQEVAIMDNNGKTIVPFKYNDVFWFENEGQLIVYIAGTKYDGDGLAGVFDLKLNQEIIKPQYKAIDYLDYNYFIISDDHEYNTNATIINEKNKIIGDKNVWRNVSISDDNNERRYEGETMSGKKYRFNIRDNAIVELLEIGEE